MKNNLFNLDSIKKYANNLLLTPEKRIKLERYVERVHNNEFKGETKGYPAFLKFLEDILDYEEDKHVLPDNKPDIGQDRVEFALKDNENRKFMVIELKGSNTDLDKPQNRANDKRTPVKQAFGYAEDSTPSGGLINWILVSNYKEFRLYNYGKRIGEYISFNVEELLEEEKFKYFMFTFSKESHIDLKAINDVINEDYIEKTQLANNFYKLFHETRLMIFKELKELHGINKIDAVSYAQKVLDRFIFICFASSRDLLPDNIAHKTLLKRIKSEDLRDYEVWRELNYLFKDVNEGRKENNISGYNGGLFKDDLNLFFKLSDIINNKNFFKEIQQENKKNKQYKEFIKGLHDKLKKEVKPSILERLNPIYINLLIISYFEFSEDKTEETEHSLDIEILGHIFENSIGDIEELKEDSKGRRKKEGIFYTPDYITDYICKNTILPYLSKGKAKTVEDLLQEYSTGREVEKLDQKLINIKIVDPACGSGAFLNKATDILLDIHKGIFDIKKGYTTSESMRVGKGKRKRTESVQHMDLGAYVFDAIEKRREILLDNIYGVDLNSESVEITKLSLFLKVCEKGKKLPELDKNIKCGNSLIDDPDYAGDKAFKWEEEFPKIFKEDKFDIVIGNPPYINIIKIPKNQLPYLKEHYLSASYGRIDLYILFMEKAINLLKNNGFTSFIIPDKFCTHKYASILRKMILKSCDIKNIVNLNGFKIFKDAVVDNIVYVFQKNDKIERDNKLLIIIPFKDQINQGRIIGRQNEIKQTWFNQIPENMFRLGLNLEIWEIIKKIKVNSNNIEEMCYVSFGLQPGKLNKFVFNKFENPERINENPEVIKKFIRGRNIERYYIRYTGDLVFYLPKELHRPAFSELFEKEKIVVSEISKDIKATYDNQAFYGNEKTVQVISFTSLKDVDQSILKGRGINLKEDLLNNSKKYDLKYILSFLNSNLTNFFFKTMISDGLNVFPDNIRKIPIYPATPNQQNLFIEKADEMLLLNNGLITEINGFKDWLQRSPYNLDKFSQKLDKYYELSFDNFLVELNKKKVDTKLRRVQELLKNEFEESVNKINPLLQQIKDTDKEINSMVYELYGLNDNEIEIIENSLV